MIIIRSPTFFIGSKLGNLIDGDARVLRAREIRSKSIPRTNRATVREVTSDFTPTSSAISALAEDKIEEPKAPARAKRLIWAVSHILYAGWEFCGFDFSPASKVTSIFVPPSCGAALDAGGIFERID